MNKIIFCGFLLSAPFISMAATDTGFDTGEILVRGQLLENTCRISLDSVHQEVDLGITSKSDIMSFGKEGREVKLVIHLYDCPEANFLSKNGQTLTNARGISQPGYSASIITVADNNNPDLIKVVGAKGFGLRLRDEHGYPVQLASHNNVRFLDAGQDDIVFSLAPVRTNEDFEPGAYHALIGFNLSYQ